MSMMRARTSPPSTRGFDPAMDVADLSQWLQQSKLALIDASGLGKDALHVYFGLAMFLAVRLLWRRRGGWVLGWAAALAMALTVEWLDMRGEVLRGDLQPDGAHWHDIWNTMFWPTILLLVGRWLQPTTPGVQETSAPSADSNNLRPS
jgi:hypothetical protein